MEIEITRFFNEAHPLDYSASVAEIGRDAGVATWSAACNDSPDYFLLDTEEKREAFKAHIAGYGAWDADEVAGWTETELNALFLQLVSGDMREAGLHSGMTDADWREYEEGCEAGQNAGRIFGGCLSVNNDGRIYYSLD